MISRRALLTSIPGAGFAALLLGQDADFKGKGLLMLAVDVGEPKKKVRKYLEESPRSCKIVLMEDTNLAAMFAPTAYPVYVLIDRDGNLAGRQNGASGENGLRRLLAKGGMTAE